jgi:hypothetical protein
MTRTRAEPWLPDAPPLRCPAVTQDWLRTRSRLVPLGEGPDQRRLTSGVHGAIETLTGGTIAPQIAHRPPGGSGWSRCPRHGALVFARMSDHVVRMCPVGAGAGMALNVRFVGPRPDAERWCSHERSCGSYVFVGAGAGRRTQREHGAHFVNQGGRGHENEPLIDQSPRWCLSKTATSKSRSKARAHKLGAAVRSLIFDHFRRRCGI